VARLVEQALVDRAMRGVAGEMGALVAAQ